MKAMEQRPKAGLGGAGSYSKKQSVDGSHPWLLFIKLAHTTERFQFVFKVSVHTLCTDCALNFLTYFIHKQLCICK